MIVRVLNLWGRASLPFVLALPLSAAAGLQLVSLPDLSFGPPASGGGDSVAAVISADGRYVAFASTAQNLVPMANSTRVSGLSPCPVNVFLRDRSSGITTLISVNLAGTAGGNSNSYPAGISTNGQFVLFESTSGDLVSGDTNNASDVFLRDLVSGTTTLISVSTNSRSGNAASRTPVMSADGRYVAFVSSATDLAAEDINGMPDVYVRDTLSGTTTLVSVGAKSSAPPPAPPSQYGIGSESPRITPDGSYVAFYSSAIDLVPGVKSAGEVYVRDLVAGTTTWASTNARSLFQSVFGTTNAISCNHRLSDDGQYVAFEACSNSAGGLYVRGMILRHNLTTGITDVVHTNANVSPTSFEDINALDLTPDGRYIAFVANDSVPAAATCAYRWDAQAGASLLVSTNLTGGVTAGSAVAWPVMDVSGRYVVFHSTATDLTTNGSAGVFVCDMQAGTTRMVNVDSNGASLSVNPAAVPVVSEDGRWVAFECPDAGRNYQSDILLRDLALEATELISVRHPGLPSLSPNGPSGFSTLSLSADGLRVAFTSEAGNLVPGDTNGYRDVFVRDLVNGTNLLVSVGTNGVPGSGFSSEPSISGSGRYVAFSSTANDLVTGDTNKAQDVFVRDLQGGTTLLVSVSTNGGPGNYESYGPQISTDGRRVLFRSKATNLAAGSFGGGLTDNLFCRDLQSGTTYALTTAAGGGVFSSAMTPNGRFVAVVDSNGRSPGTIYLWDAQAGTRISTNTTGSGVSFVSLSPDGGTIVGFAGYYTPAPLCAINVAANTNWIISQGFSISRVGLQFSDDGRFLAYATATSSVVIPQVYLYDFQTRSNQLVSRNYKPGAAGNDSADSPAISPDGRFVAYRCFATNGLPEDFNAVPDLFLYDRLQHITRLVSANQYSTTVADNRSLKPAFSGDSRMLVFQSWASDLLGQDFNQASDIFALTLVPSPIFDSDNDGMDDQWEMDHFGTLARAGTGDYDEDGATDLMEFQTGTDPTDPASCFRVDIRYSGMAGATHSITWPIAPGRTYRVQFKHNLGDPVWQDLNGSMIIIGDTGYLIDLTAGGDHRFYRGVLVADADADGMDDGWELEYFRALDRDGAGDNDGDGATDLNEYLAGTNPTDPASRFQAEISYSGAAGQYPLITWFVAPGRTYLAQYKDALDDPVWQDLSGGMSVVGNTASIYDLSPPVGQRFYRIVLNP
jgi:Tol biopolymer transport system component